MSYLAELTIENADTSQYCADSVLVISCRHGNERNLHFDDITIFDQLRFDRFEPVTCQSRMLRCIHQVQITHKLSPFALSLLRK